MYASLPDPLPPFNEDRCGLCGELADDEMGEFTIQLSPYKEVVEKTIGTSITDEEFKAFSQSWPDKREHSIYAHGQCGLDHGLELA